MAESIADKCKRLGFKPHGQPIEEVRSVYDSCQYDPIHDALWCALRDSVKVIGKGRKYPVKARVTSVKKLEFNKELFED